MFEVIALVVLVGVPFIVLLFVLPITSIVRASRALNRLINLESQVDGLNARLNELSEQIKTGVKADNVISDHPSEKAIASVDSEISQKPFDSDEVIQTPIVESAYSFDTENTDDVADTASTVIDNPFKAEEATDNLDIQTKPQPDVSIEERIGVVWFTRIGAAVGMVVAGWFFKYMVDNDWIGPWGRVAAGALTGVIALAIGELLYRRKRTHHVFNQGMLGLGLALLLITSYAAFGFYHLISAPAAFAIIGVIAFLGGALSHFHKSELILVFSLVAVFLNPIMLSTGRDRPVALFTYLLVMTAAAHWLSFKNGFKTAAYVAVGGTTALFIGWYGRYFDLSPAPPAGIYDDPSLNQPGAYFSMAKRWIPLLFSTLFVTEWMSAALLHLRKERKVLGTALLLIAAVTSHAAMAALLYDSPSVLGGALLIFGAGFAFLFVRLELTSWLFLTMMSSFGILACLKEHIDKSNIVIMLTLIGALSALYFSIFLKSELAQDRKPSPTLRIFMALSGLGFFILGIIILMPDHYRSFAVLTAFLSGAFLLTAVLISSSIMFIGTSIAGLIGLMVSYSECDEADWGFIAIAGLWFVLHAGIVVLDALKRRREWTYLHMFILSIASLGFTGLFLSSLPSEQGISRALLSLAQGIVLFVIGATAARSASCAKGAALIPLGCAALSFTSALAFLLTGPSLTIAWAAEAVIIAYLAAQIKIGDKDVAPWLTTASAAVFTAALVNFFSVDYHWVSDQQQNYLNSSGAKGSIVHYAFANPAAWSLFGLGAGLLTGLYCLRKKIESLWVTGFKIAFMIFGHAFIMWMFIREFELLFAGSPDIPAGLPMDEATELMLAYLTNLSDKALLFQSITTVIMGVYALALIAFGFVIREAKHRVFGMLLFGVTVIKLSLYDIWQFETLFRIIVGGAVAFLLLIGGFLYARFGSRLKSMVVDGNTKTTALLAFLVVSSITSASQAFEKETFATIRDIPGITEHGDYSLEIDPILYSLSSSPSPLSDIRIAGPGGEEVPFIIVSAPDYDMTSKKNNARIFDPQKLQNGSFRVLADMGEAAPVHDGVSLIIQGSEYLCSVTIESSADGVSFGVLAEGEPVYNIVWGNTRAVKSKVEYPQSKARFVRITLTRSDNKPAPSIDAVNYYETQIQPQKKSIRSLPLSIEDSKPMMQTADDKREAWYLKELPRGVSIDSLRIETKDQEFVREISVESSTHKNAWFSEGSGSVYRLERTIGGKLSVLEQLTISIGRFSRPFLRLIVDNGDNPPLKIEKVFAEYKAQNLILRAKTAGPHTLYVGNAKANAPRYDLSSILAQTKGKTYKKISLGESKTNPLYKQAESKPKEVPWTERHAMLIQIAIVIVSILLLLWTIRLLKNSKR